MNSSLETSYFHLWSSPGTDEETYERGCGNYVGGRAPASQRSAKFALAIDPARFSLHKKSDAADRQRASPGLTRR
jgi:hypothetical protein